MQLIVKLQYQCCIKLVPLLVCNESSGMIPKRLHAYKFLGAFQKTWGNRNRIVLKCIFYRNIHGRTGAFGVENNFKNKWDVSGSELHSARGAWPSWNPQQLIPFHDVSSCCCWSCSVQRFGLYHSHKTYQTRKCHRLQKFSSVCLLSSTQFS